MAARKTLVMWTCILCVTACTTQQDAWREHFNAGQKALQKKDIARALKEFDLSGKLAQMELNHIEPGDQKRILTVLQQLADSKTSLAKVKLDSGDLVGARSDLLDALKIAKRLHGEKDETVATIYSALATIAYEQDKFAEAETYAKSAYDIRLQVLGDKHPHVAIAANNLAEVYQKLGKDEEAEKMFEQCLNIYEKSDNQTGALDVLNNLSMFYKKLGRLDDARRVIEEALEIERQDPNVSLEDRAMTLNALGAVNKALYEFDAAEVNYTDAIKLLDHDPEHHAATLCDALDNYADFLLQKNDYERAEPVYKRAIELCTKSRGAEHASTAERLQDLGSMYKNMDRLPEAEAALKRALAIEEKNLDADSPRFLETVYKLSAVYQSEKKYEEASALYENVLPKLEKVYGPKHPYIADVLENWAGVLDDSPSHQRQVNRLLVRAREIRGKHHVNTNSGGDSRHQPPRTMPPKERES